MLFKSKAKKEAEAKEAKKRAEEIANKQLQKIERLKKNDLVRRIISKTHDEFLNCLQTSFYSGIDWHFRDGKRTNIRLKITFKVFRDKINVTLFIPSIEDNYIGTEVSLANFSFFQESYPDISLNDADMLARILSNETCKILKTTLQILSIDNNWSIDSHVKYVSDFWEQDRYRDSAEAYVEYSGYPKYPRRTNSW